MNEHIEASVNQQFDQNLQPVEIVVQDYPGGLRACLEAILIASDQPQTSQDLGRILNVDADQVDACLEKLAEEIQDQERGYRLQRSVRGWLYTSDPVYQPVVAAFITDGQTARLSQAALETLAIIAYRQPITRAQIASIRGVNSDGVTRSLLVRDLIREEGVDPQTRAALLVTTTLFLEKMDIESVDQLPSLAPFLPEDALSVQEMMQKVPEA